MFPDEAALFVSLRDQELVELEGVGVSVDKKICLNKLNSTPKQIISMTLSQMWPAHYSTALTLSLFNWKILRHFIKMDRLFPPSILNDETLSIHVRFSFMANTKRVEG